MFSMRPIELIMSGRNSYLLILSAIHMKLPAYYRPKEKRKNKKTKLVLKKTIVSNEVQTEQLYFTTKGHLVKSKNRNFTTRGDRCKYILQSRLPSSIIYILVHTTKNSMEVSTSHYKRHKGHDTCRENLP